MKVKLKKNAELDIIMGTVDSTMYFSKGSIFKIDPNDEYDDDAYMVVGKRANEFSVIVPKKLCVAVK